MCNHNDLYIESKLYKIRHSSAHILAQAVLEVFPEAKLGIGPPIDDGFYYDFDLPRSLNNEDLERIEERMKKIIKSGFQFSYNEISPEKAKEVFSSQPYKIELIEDLLSGKRIDENGNLLTQNEKSNLKLTTYQQDSFLDLCKGPHVNSTIEIDPEALKLLSVAGAYWRGDSNRPMLQRIYGTIWESKEDLDIYLNKLEEAKKRDHRVLGKSLELFDTVDDIGKGLILWHPKGALIRFLADRFSQEAHLLNGYEWVYTPHIGKSKLWETSGHLDFYKDGMYAPIDIEGDLYYLKPMNCPFHIHIYGSRPRSYRELPLKLAEFGTVYRYELSGALHGLTRVRGFTQDDAHIFCTPEQAQEEIIKALKFSIYVLKAFGFNEFKAYVATRPENKSIGTLEDWDYAITRLTESVKAVGLTYDIDEGGGAFYGPKIDIKVLDALGREWQLSTVQFDFNLPKRFGMTYIGPDGNEHQPIMIHRALFGSAERFFGLLIEHHGGAFPLWLAPVQVDIITITDNQLEYANEIAKTLRDAGMRAKINSTKERMQEKIRLAETNKTPFMFVIGKKEMANCAVSVRKYKEGDLGSMSLDAFFEMVKPDLQKAIPKALDN